MELINTCNDNSNNIMIIIMVGNLSRGGVMIKILVWRHFELTPQFMSELCLLNKQKLT